MSWSDAKLVVGVRRMEVERRWWRVGCHADVGRGGPWLGEQPPTIGGVGSKVGYALSLGLGDGLEAGCSC